mgnify:CR=1 FL=1
MSDEPERQLEAFGATLESTTGEPIRASDHGRGGHDRSHHRAWAMIGAAACLLAAVVGLVVVTGRDAEAPTARPPATTSPAVPIYTFDREVLRSAPIAEVVDACEPHDVLVAGENDQSAPTTGAAFAIAYATIVDHTPPEVEMLPADGWVEIAGDPLTVRFLDRGSGIEAIVRMRYAGSEWHVAEIAQCLTGRLPAVVQTTTIPSTVPSIDPALAADVPDDPLALERDGWTLVQRTTEPFVGGEVPCEAGQGLSDFDGAPSVHDILTPPDGTGLDVDLQVLDVGSIERGNRLTDVLVMIGRCAAESQGVEGETGGLSSIRASWFRAGPDFALVTIVGEGARSIVFEIEGAPFDDDLIGELAHRADQFLRGAPISTESTFDDDPAESERPEIPQRQMTAAERERFGDDVTGGLVCDERGRGGGNWDWEPVGPDDVENREPVDEFWAAIDDNVRDMQREGGVPYPTDGWTELIGPGGMSLFVLEVEGEAKATITVTGDPESGVWRRAESAACQSLFIP